MISREPHPVWWRFSSDQSQAAGMHGSAINPTWKQWMKKEWTIETIKPTTHAEAVCTFWYFPSLNVRWVLPVETWDLFSFSWCKAEPPFVTACWEVYLGKTVKLCVVFITAAVAHAQSNVTFVAPHPLIAALFRFGVQTWPPQQVPNLTRLSSSSTWISLKETKSRPCTSG